MPCCVKNWPVASANRAPPYDICAYQKKYYKSYSEKDMNFTVFNAAKTLESRPANAANSSKTQGTVPKLNGCSDLIATTYVSGSVGFKGINANFSLAYNENTNPEKCY